jgi:hypothetical protein
MTKLVMVEMLSAFRLRYVVQIEDDDSVDEAVYEVMVSGSDSSFNEFSQKHIEPTSLIDRRVITEEEYLKMFDEDNDYLASWSETQKKSFINVIDNTNSMENDDGA